MTENRKQQKGMEENNKEKEGTKKSEEQEITAKNEANKVFWHAISISC